MSALPLVLTIAGVAFVVALRGGVSLAFRWLYLPALFCAPIGMEIAIPGLPDLTVHRALVLVLVLAAFARGEIDRLTPRWCWIDVLALLPVLSFSISYGLSTDFKGSYHCLAVLLFDWAAPYVFTRALLRDMRAVRAALPPLAIGITLMAFAAVLECRLAYRISTTFWNSMGADLPIVPHWGSWRSGYLRATATHGHPIILGSVFAAAMPLMALWYHLDRDRRYWAMATMLGCAAGCIAALSRGPILALGVVSIGLLLCRMQRTNVLIAVILVAALSAPSVHTWFVREWSATHELVERTGNAAGQSGRYRLALLMIYPDQVLEAGPWGGSGSFELDEHYAGAWSTDNSYLFLLLTGGWIGGGAMCLLVLTLLAQGARRLGFGSSRARPTQQAVFFSFVAVSLCMGNVWFSRGLSFVFWVSAALTLNLVIYHAAQAARPGGGRLARPRLPADLVSCISQHQSGGTYAGLGPVTHG